MTTLCHVFDESAAWEHRIASGQLLDRLSGEKFAQHLVAIDAPAKTAQRNVQIIPRIAGLNFFAAPLRRRTFDRQEANLIHAWGPSAAACAASASQLPLVVELFDPQIAVDSAKLLRSISRPAGFAIVCGTQWVRRRLIENGVAPDVCVVIRPGVDFALLQKVRKSGLRAQLGIAPDDFVIVLPEPQRTGENHRAAFWAASLLNHLDGGYKLIVPGHSRAAERIARFAAALPTRPTLITPDIPPLPSGRRSAVAEESRREGNNVDSRNDPVPFEHLVAIADALVVPDTDEDATTAIAWSMAAGAAVIAAASYSVTELIVSKVNGLLYKQPSGKSPALRIIPLLRDRETRRKVREAARGQAYEVFSLRRYVEQHAQVYENLLSGAPASHGITDPAQVA